MEKTVEVMSFYFHSDSFIRTQFLNLASQSLALEKYKTSIMKRTSTYLFYFLMLLLFSCQNKKTTSNQEENPISGAYESLNFLGEAKVYPFEEYPSEAHFAAWKKAQNETTTREDTDPWEAIGPHNRGGRTLNLAFNPQNPNTIYAGSASGGLWRTYTSGFGAVGWEMVDTGFPILGVSTIAFAPGDSTTMYIGTGEVYNFFAAGTGAAYRSTRGSYGIGILKSTDGGETWALSLDWTAEQTRGIWAIRVDENNPNTIWAATTDGIYKSDNAGGDWAKKLDVVMGNDLLINPNNSNELVAACGNFGSTGVGIYYSTDAGENWTFVDSGLPTGFLGKIQLALSPSEPGVVWASIGNGFSTADGATWLCKSTDFGQSWEVVNTTDYSIFQGWFAHDVAVHPENGDYLINIGITVWNSLDGGETLNPITQGGIGDSNPLPQDPDGPPDFVHSDSHDVIFHPNDPNIVYIACDGGVYRSEDAGLTWRSVNGGYQTAQFYNGFSTSQTDSILCMGGLQDNGTWIWNGDKTWRNVFGGDGAWTAIDADNDNTVYVSSQRINMYRVDLDAGSYDYLEVPEISPVAFIAPYVTDKINGNTIYVGSSVISKSTNSGFDWSNQNDPDFDGNPFLSMEISAENADVVYAATAPFNGQRGHVYATQDGGNDWEDVTQNLPDRYPMDMTVSPDNEAVAFITFSGFGEGHVFRTEDYGQTWEDISFGLPDVPTNAIVVDPLLPNNVYVGNDIGVWYSTDLGDTWQSYQDGLPTATMIFDLKITNANRKLRIATHGNGAYQRDLVDESVNTTAPIANLELSIFPNPFFETVTIKYELNQQQEVHIDCLDATGRILKTITSGIQMTGNQQLTMDGAALAQGIYFLRFKIGGEVFVKRLVK